MTIENQLCETIQHIHAHIRQARLTKMEARCTKKKERKTNKQKKPDSVSESEDIKDKHSKISHSS